MKLLYIIAFVLSNYCMCLCQQWQAQYEASSQALQAKNYSESLNLAFKALNQAEIEFGDSSKVYSYSLSQIGHIYYALQNYDSAVYYFKKEKDFKKIAFGSNHQSYAAALNNLCVVLQKLDKYYEAEPLLIESIKIKTEANPRNDSSLAFSLNNLGQLYQSIGRMAEAEKAYLQALSIKKKIVGINSYSYAISLLNLAILQSSVGNFDEAEINFANSYQVLSKIVSDNDSEAMKALFNYAKILINNNKNNQAEPLLKKYKDLQKRKTGDKNPDYAESVYSLAILELEKKNYTDSEKLIIEALDLYESIYGNASKQYIDCLYALGILYSMKGDYIKSKEILSKVVEIRKKTLGELHQEYINALHSYAGVLKETNNIEESENKYIESMNLYLKLIENYFPYLNETEKTRFYYHLKNRFEMFNNFILFRSRIIDSAGIKTIIPENPNLISQIYDFHIATKAMIYNSQKKIRNLILNSNNDELIKKYENWLKIRDDIANLNKISKQQQNRSGKNLDSLESLAARIDKELSEQSLDFKKEYNKKTCSWKDIQKQLKPNEVAIEIVRFRFFAKQNSDSIYYIALINYPEINRFPEIVLLKNGNQLEEKYLNNYINSIKAMIPDNDSYNAFWEQLDHKLNNYNTLIISLDGVYNKININSIKNNNNNQYMIDYKTIKIVSNTSDIINFNKTNNTWNGDVCLFGFPQFSLITNNTQLNSADNIKYDNSVRITQMQSIKNSIPELPGTKSEIEKISELFKETRHRVNTFLGNQSTETNFKSCKNPYLLHIATHGFFLKNIENVKDIHSFQIDENKAHDNPLLRSGLLFAGAVNTLNNIQLDSTMLDNGILTAYEAMNLYLDSTRLLVMSACETGLGELKNGEGVYGLQRAFSIAGAKAIIMSLWRVDDEVTQLLMANFYNEWITKSLPLSQAFRNAQINIKKEYPHPYYWGAFVLLGE